MGSGISTWNNQFKYDRISRLKLEDFDGKSCAFVFDRLRSERLIEVGGDIDHIKQTYDGALINGRWEFDHLKRRIHITLGLSVGEGECQCYYCTATEGCVDSGNSDSFDNFASIVKHHLDSWR